MASSPWALGKWGQRGGRWLPNRTAAPASLVYTGRGPASFKPVYAILKIVTKKYYIGIGLVIVVAVVVGLIQGGTGKTLPSKPLPTKTYVALGDSVAAGVGLADASDSSACDRTNQAYPNLVASALNYRLRNFACSGATLAAGILGQQDVNDLLIAPQLQQLFAQPKPTLISLTIGANDVGWTTIIAKCYAGSCGSASDTASVDAKLVTVSANLRAALTQIQTRYPQATPRVIVTGYHQVFPAATVPSCPDLTGIDAAELSWGRQLQTSINDTLRQATSGYSFASFVPVDFSGHELCTADPWVQGLSDQQPYHPTAAGQAEFARQIVTAVRSVR